MQQLDINVQSLDISLTNLQSQWDLGQISRLEYQQRYNDIGYQTFAILDDLAEARDLQIAAQAELADLRSRS
jgi:hypothetical protein